MYGVQRVHWNIGRVRDAHNGKRPAAQRALAIACGHTLKDIAYLWLLGIAAHDTVLLAVNRVNNVEIIGWPRFAVEHLAKSHCLCL
jgi:hypothetical protein